MSNEQQLNELARDVREQGLNQGSTMKDLVFDPVTGDFRQVERGASHGDGDVVTEMTDKGFAAGEENPKAIVVIREDDLNGAVGQLQRKKRIRLPAAEIEEGVYHVNPDSASRLVTDDEIGCYMSLEDRLPKIPFGDDWKGVCVLHSGEKPRAFVSALSKEEKRNIWCEADLYLIPSEENLFSRSKGILEVGVLKDKRVMIVGLGSFGSRIAVELAQAGVGSFALMDFDRVEIHNLSRHIASVRDLGRLKTNVIEEAILGKNPYARVDKFPVNINEDIETLRDEVAKADLVICATDNNSSRYNLSSTIANAGKVGIYGRAFTRAEGGDVLIQRPSGPCYCCLVGSGDLQQEEITDVASARRDGRIAAYVSPEDADAMVQVGLSSDIAPICDMMVKLSLLELSRGRESGISCLEKELVYDYYIWANRREKRFSNWKPMPEAGGMPTILRWYGARIERDKECPVCGESVTLDGAEDSPTIESLHEQLKDMNIDLG